MSFKKQQQCNATQRDFQNHFNNILHDVPDFITILKWVTAFNNTGFVLKKISESECSICTPENVIRVRLSAVQSPSQSVCLRVASCGLLETTVC